MAVLIICCILSVKYLLLMQCYITATLQQLTAAAYYSCLISAYCVPVVSYFIAAFSICYVASVEYMLHMQCCRVAKIQNLTAADYSSGQV